MKLSSSSMHCQNLWPNRDKQGAFKRKENLSLATAFKIPKAKDSGDQTIGRISGGPFTYIHIGELRIQPTGVPLSFNHPVRFVLVLVLVL
jgi:hypothetical protein